VSDETPLATAPPASEADQEHPTLAGGADIDRRSGVTVPRWFALTGVVLLIAGLGFAIGWLVTPGDNGSSRSASQSTPSQGGAPSATAPSPPTSTTPGASALSNVGLRQSDLSSSLGLALVPNGNTVAGAPTLDLCNGAFPSESLRRARLQVAAANAQGNVAISTEAVLYANASATDQAFSELKSVAANCPSAPVASPVGEPTTTTKFNPAPDGSWPQVGNVDRLAFDFVATDQAGQQQHSIAVYLRRGRALLGVYFPSADSQQASIAGQTSTASIVDVFAHRMAELPASVVNS